MFRAMALISCVFLLFPSVARAQEGKGGEPRHVHLSFVPEIQKLAPGQNFRVAIIQSIDPEWHTYWYNPGDSGTPMKISWTLPEGFRAGAMEWPVPERIPSGPLVNFGYSGETVFLQDFTAPRTLPPGPLTFTADIELLVCRDICIPEISRQSFTIGASDVSASAPALFARAAKALPARIPAQAKYREQDGRLVLTLESADSTVMNALRMGSAELFPSEWGVIDNPSKTQVGFDKNSLTLAHPRGMRPLNEISTLRAVVAFPDGSGGRRGIEIEAIPETPSAPGGGKENANPASQPRQNDDVKNSAGKSDPASPNAIAPPPAKGTGMGFLSALVFALLGGLVLNLMPCVFPVLSIKALGSVQLAHKHPGLARAHGLAYTAGVIASFLAIAGTLSALRAAGTAIGWGFQLQNPLVVTALSFLLFGIGLNLLGMFEISVRLPKAIHKHYTQSQGLPGAFLTGILATLVATPCTAPFMGAAVGYAAVQPAPVSLSVFAALGLGLALPYLALSFVPALQRALPRPGAWMENFRQFLAFPMFASAAWLVWVLAQQTGDAGVLGALLGMIALAFGVWTLRLPARTEKTAWTLRVIAALAFVATIESALWVARAAPSQESGESFLAERFSEGFGEPFSQETLGTLLSGPDPVFVEMTAAWCITCKVNHKVAIDVFPTRDLFERHRVRYLVGDWTNADPQITQYLESFGRAGVPLYVWYAAPDASGKRPEPVVLPQILTPGLVHDTIEP